jgi:exodeoxyribonuclease X
MLAMVLDTETTGLHQPQVIELATKGPLEWTQHTEDLPVSVQRYLPSKPIEPGAMATHGIIMEDLVGCPPSPTAPWHPGLVTHVIGHNVDSDLAVLGNPSVRPICTLILARRLWESEASHKLSTMMYVLFEASMARELTRDAHAAHTDVTNTCLLLDACIYELQSRGHACRNWEDLAQLTLEFRIPLRIGFSKYGPKNGQPGTPYPDIPSGMLEWILDPKRVNDMDPWEVKAALREMRKRGER